MDKLTTPAFESWYDLSRVADHIDLIVDDAPKRYEVSTGLLGAFGGEAIGVPQDPVTSRFATDDGYLFDQTLRTDLQRIIPGIEDIGGNREVRLKTVRERLAGQGAFSWLNGQPSFRAALDTAKYLASRNDVAYQSDIVDFKMIRATWFPIHIHHRGITFGYPTREEVGSAAEQVESLLKFLATSGGLVRTRRITYVSQEPLQRLAAELGDIQRSYKKPRATGPVAEVEFGIDVAKGLQMQFGATSPKILSAFLDLIEYDHDEARVREIVNKAQATGGYNLPILGSW